MGAYLNKPVTEKHCESGSNDRVRYGATTMQGWRINQEDAHNCMLDFDDSISMFAVYDGHGGSEVAQYTALHFPQFLKSRDEWKAGNYAKAIEESFLDFDDLLRSDKVMKELKKMANHPTSKLIEKELSDDEDKAALYEEASMPLESILQRYGFVLRRGRNGTTESIKTFEEIENEDDGSVKVAESDPNGEVEIKINGDDLKTDGDKSTDKAKKRTGEITRTEEAGVKRAKPCEENENNGKNMISNDVSDTNNEDVNHEITPSASADAINAVVCSSNGDAPDGGKVTRKRTADKNSSIEKPDEKGKQPTAECCSKSGEIPQPSATPETDSNSEQDEDYNGDDEELSEVEEEESELEDIDEDDAQYGYGSPTGDMPGEDSGTTACVAIVFKDKLIVGNAGDSRAVLCRSGVPVDLSLDHKPEDDTERTRIEAAGGQISIDGRVNGGLNLSRALGDHFYKKNASLPLKDQMISALPDITEHTIDENDEFIIVACDGIWNSMTNEEAVEFVKEGLDAGLSLDEICNQVCEHCLSPHSAGDGTGCDNMTIIIAQILHSPARTNESN